MLNERPARRTPTIVRPKLDPFWVGWMGLYFANRPDLTPADISELAKAKAPEVGWSSPPARATSYKYFDAYQYLPEHIRVGYKYFSWPEAMIDGSLPWEATRAALDLLAWTEEHELSPPTTAIAKWFWRATLALPDTSLGLRLRVALTAATSEEAGEPLPDELKKLIIARAVPQDYRPQIKTGGASSAWAVEAGLFNRAARDALYEE